MENMKESHRGMFELLVEFDDFCKSYDIEYALGWGTLLGCVREGKFIEWDDDLDVVLSYENLLKLQQKAKMLPPHLSIDFASMDKPYYDSLTHKIYTSKSFITDSQNKKHMVFLDIFDLKETGSLISVVTNTLVPIVNRRKFSEKSWKRKYLNTSKYFWRLVWPVLFYLSDHQTKKTHLNYRDLSFSKWGFKKTDFFPIKKDPNYTLYGRVFPIPHNPEKILSITYGKDWKIPYKDPSRIHFQ